MTKLGPIENAHMFLERKKMALLKKNGANCSGHDTRKPYEIFVWQVHTPLGGFLLVFSLVVNCLQVSPDDLL